VRNNPSREEILNDMQQIGKLIRERGAPSLITISRSLDGYTPAHLHHLIESELLKIIRENVPNVDVKYYPGVDSLSKDSKSTRDLDPADVREFLEEIEEMTKQDFNEMEPIRKMKMRNIALVESYARRQNVRVTDVFHNVKHFLAWKKEELKKNPHKQFLKKKKQQKKVRIFNIYSQH
jgi:hypothetical protein